MAAEKKKNAKAAKGSKTSGGGKFIVIMVVFGALVPFGLPTLLVCAGFFPTLVALLTDKDPGKSGLISIGLLNTAGVVPFLIELWQKNQTMEAALGIVGQPLTWLVMFGTAAVGQLLLYAVPPAMVMMTLTRMEIRRRRLQEGLTQLQNIWGSDVATSKPLELIRKSEQG